MGPNHSKKFERRSSNAKSSQTGLSLTTFAKAKKNSYDPRVIKEKDRIRAAKTVNKYKKLKQRLQASSPTTAATHSQACLLQNKNHTCIPLTVVHFEFTGKSITRGRRASQPRQ